MLQYWQLALTGVTLVTSSIGVVLGWRSNMVSTSQRELQARREEWWRRSTWAISLLSEPEEFQREIGMRVVKHLARSSLLGHDERAVIEEVTGAVFQRRESNAHILATRASNMSEGEGCGD